MSLLFQDLAVALWISTQARKGSLLKLFYLLLILLLTLDT